jgi:hypothetical protein
MAMNRYIIKLRQFGTGEHTIAGVYDQSNNNLILVHQTDFGKNPEKIARKARKWVRQREKADLIAEGRRD